MVLIELLGNMTENSNIELYEYNPKTKREKKLFEGWQVELLTDDLYMNKVLLIETHRDALKILIEKQ